MWKFVISIVFAILLSIIYSFLNSNDSILHTLAKQTPTFQYLASFFIQRNTILDWIAIAHQQNANGQSALHLVCYHNGSYDYFLKLISIESDINLQDINGTTPLIAATLSNQTLLVEYLLQKGADVNVLTTLKKQNALMIASWEGYYEIVQLLLSMRSLVDTKDSNGCTALILAIYKGYQSIVELLIKNNADIEVRDKLLTTPLIYAAGKGHVTITKLLVAHKADIHSKDRDGKTSLMWAAHKGYFDIVQFLLTQGAKINDMTTGNKTALDFAIENNHIEIQQLLKNY